MEQRRHTSTQSHSRAANQGTSRGVSPVLRGHDVKDKKGADMECSSSRFGDSISHYPLSI